jgi:hypothetical protein
MQKRKALRQLVNIPIFCTLAGKNKKIYISSTGNVLDISHYGMRVNIPIPLEHLRSQIIDYRLHLPEPFSQIQGKGRIKWVVWNDKIQQTTFGMELLPLPESHQSDINTLLLEIAGATTA